jgi:hypothetical protein
MKKLGIAAGSLAGLALLVGGVVAAGALKSGPQVGEAPAGPFEPLNVTGPDAGEKVCLYCKNGNHPVAMIFARDVSGPVTSLIKKIDAATAEHKDAKMGSFVVFLGDEQELSGKLKELANKEGIKNTVLSIFDTPGPNGYGVSPDADVTVVLYTKRNVKANYAFRKGELTDKDIDTVLAAVPKILPE